MNIKENVYMSKKNFQSGIEAGAKPFEEKFKLQAESIEKNTKKISRKLDEFGNILDDVIDGLTSYEKKELYDLNTPQDILDLDETEKEFILSALYQLADDLEKPSLSQQGYIRSLKAYLKIVSSQTKVDLSCVENFENINAQKAILQVVMEFLFLGEDQHNYTKQHEEFLECFNVNIKSRTLIKSYIDNIYKATGAQGLADRYGYVPLYNSTKSDLFDKEQIKKIQEIVLSWEEGWTGFIDVNLTPGISQMCLGSTFTSMSKCKKTASDLLKQAYNDASSYVSKYGNKSLCKQITNEVYDELEDDFNKILYSFRSLSQLDDQSDEVSKIEQILNIEEFRTRVSNELENELTINSSYYGLFKFSHYEDKIEYMDFNIGFDEKGSGIFTKAFELVRQNGMYAHEAGEVWNELNSDLEQRVRMFEKSAKSSIQKILKNKYATLINQFLNDVELKIN